MTAVHQLLPAVAPHDAITAHALQVDRLLRDLGVETAIYAGDVHPALRGRVRPHTDLPSGGRAGVALYHASIGSAVAAFVRRRSEPVVVDYHNVTPPGFVLPWEPALAEQLARGRRELARFADRAVLGLGDSEYNRRELVDLGYATTAVAPILFDVATLAHTPDTAVADRLRRAKARGGADWLFVGRVSPHKAQDALVRAFLVYRATYDPSARLHIVGGAASARYRDALVTFVAASGGAGAIDLVGRVSAESLSAYYDAADVFVCVSRHEGFCVPLLEAMYHDVPIVAARAGAVPETAGDAALLLPSAAPAVVATAVDRVLRDDGLRDALVAAGRSRLADFDLGAVRRRFTDALRPVLES